MAHFIVFERIDNIAKVFLKDSYIQHPILGTTIHNDPIIDISQGTVPLNLPTIAGPFPMEMRVEVFNVNIGESGPVINPAHIRYKIIESVNGQPEVLVPGIVNPIQLYEASSLPWRNAWVIGYILRFQNGQVIFEQVYIKDGNGNIIG